MDGSEGMTISGSASYYLNRGGVSGSGSGSQTGLPAPPGFRPLSNPNVSIQSNVRADSVGSIFQEDDPSPNFPHHHGTMSMVVSSSNVVSPGDPVKKKRGRPRKYGPDGASSMSLALSPMSLAMSPGSTTPGEKKGRGRPPGSGRKQQLASLGEWMNSSAGLAFTPHIIHIAIGEDIAAKILSFAQQRPRALCVLSANGSVSVVTLRQPISSGGTVTYEGRFEILCLSGSYLLADSGGPRHRTGGLSISVCSPDGHVIGGGIGGRLIAASLIQVVVCSFVYGGPKTKNKAEVSSKGDKSSVVPAENLSPPATAATNTTAPVIWPPSSRPDLGNSHTEIDLTRG
ncbi:hypothetical protein RJ639_033811 [Escallonia herrerae]|uniref:AT-hook motif nuclear-localized protein n=1 Tax=Escallonia herrerae TaxID=1293975 RepID=A0AA88X9F7_9ASTE|nr:hypothetical protein RJ639_033811 [Escallonia herrerae]